MAVEATATHSVRAHLGASFTSIRPLHVNPPAKSYPIVDVSYLLFYGNNNGVHLSDKTTLVKYMYSNSAATIESKLEYSPLSNSIGSAAISALNGNGGSQPACLQ